MWLIGVVLLALILAILTPAPRPPDQPIDRQAVERVKVRLAIGAYRDGLLSLPLAAGLAGCPEWPEGLAAVCLAVRVRAVLGPIKPAGEQRDPRPNPRGDQP